MACRRLFKNAASSLKRMSATAESGIALFMVMAAMAILSVVVSEFTYVAQVNSKMAVDSVDSIQAHYLAKTGLKISLIRLKAYMTLKNFSRKQGSGGFQLPSDILEKIWSFPFMYPIPKDLPGMTPTLKDEIAKFEKDSALGGKFSATIESDSQRVNLNTILEDFAAKPKPSPPPGGRRRSGTGADTGAGDNPLPNPSASPSYDPARARESVRQMMAQILDEKVRTDQDFADEYRDFELDEFFDNLLAWMDYSHQPQNRSGRQVVPYKRAPLYHLSELLMIHPVDDGIYQLLSEHFSAGMSQGINVNEMKEPLLRALFSGLTDEEVAEFFKFRDNPEEDNRFKKEDDFWKYAQKFTTFRGDEAEVNRYRSELQARGIRIVIDEENFKIRVVAEVNGARRILEAWVTVSDPTQSRSRTTNPGNPGPGDPIPGEADGDFPELPAQGQNSGLRITFMRES